jgi:hypothetical protein
MKICLECGLPFCDCIEKITNSIHSLHNVIYNINNSNISGHFSYHTCMIDILMIAYDPVINRIFGTRKTMLDIHNTLQTYPNDKKILNEMGKQLCYIFSMYHKKLKLYNIII